MALALAVSACDAVEPVSRPILVVESFLESDRALGPVRLRQTIRMDRTYDAATARVSGASVRLFAPGREILYDENPARGTYETSEAAQLSAGTPFRLEVAWQDQFAVAEGVLPPPVRLTRIETLVPPEPVEAVLLDSLQIDSLQTGARSGYVYPVEVRVWWDRADFSVEADSLYWIRAQLRPSASVAPGVVELIFRSGQILREDRAAAEAGQRRWTGVYLVMVDDKNDPIPPHLLRVAVLRSGEDYARFASSRTAPERREPISNVRGAIGIAAGISVDSLTVWIE